MKAWTHLHVTLFGKVAPCCNSAWGDDYALGDINMQSVDEVWNGELMRDFRLALLRDEPNFRCHSCYKQEDAGLFSVRNSVNEAFAHKLQWALRTDGQGFAAQAKPVTWDIRISNLCNFKCRICGHHSSSHWFEDAQSLGFQRASQSEAVWHNAKVNPAVKNFDLLMKQLDFVIPDLEEIYFAGGEPLLMDEHYAILYRLIESGKTNVRLVYNTNFSQTTYKGKDVLTLWAQFEHVIVNASLDDSGIRAELQRCGQVWKQAEDNRRRMMEICPQVEFVIASTISVFNIQHLPNYHREWTERGLILVNQFLPHTLMHPPHYSVTILPRQIKERAEDKLLKHIDWLRNYARQHPDLLSPKIQLNSLVNELTGCITYMNSRDDSHLIPEFCQLCDRLDKLRNENTRAVFPELKEMWL